LLFFRKKRVRKMILFS